MKYVILIFLIPQSKLACSISLLCSRAMTARLM